METLVSTFHIDAKLLLAQVINFGIVFFILYKFALGPIVKIMKERADKIEKGLEDAKKIEARMVQSEAEYQDMMSKAKKEAAQIMEKATQDAEVRSKEALAKAREEIGAVINQEREKMQTEKAETLREIKAEISGLVIASVEKILGEKMDVSKDKELIERSLKS